ncbi:MAG: NADH-ubiquinone oxidoreductase-F iron-sulfur binding region domain-containing protein [Actinomycetales bacterium]
MNVLDLPHPSTPATPGDDLVSLLHAAGLDGRGGGGFSTATKIEQARRYRARLIVNGCDGEIGADKDTAVLTHRLDEVLRAVALVAAPSARFAVHRDSPVAGHLRRNGLDVLEVPDRYVSSEASALVSLAAGGDARPLAKRTRLVQGAVTASSRRLPPTLVLNAETMLRIAQIAEHGPQWFRAQGTPTEPGPRLVTIGGAVRSPGVFETTAGADLAAVLDAAGFAGGHVHAGGLSGGWVPAHAVPSTTWSGEGLAPFGAGIGAGTLHVLDEGACPLSYVSTLARYAAGQSAGQCGPCMFGLPAVAEDLHLVLGGDAAALARLRHRIANLYGRGACHFPDGVAALLASTLTIFEPVVQAHLDRRCRLDHSGQRPLGGQR